MYGHLPECLHGKCANPTRADEDEVVLDVLVGACQSIMMNLRV